MPLTEPELNDAIVKLEADRQQLDEDRRRFNDSVYKDRAREEQGFSKYAPSYEIGKIPWATFRAQFAAKSFGYQYLTENSLKCCMWANLGPNAFQLANPDFNPIQEPFKSMPFDTYADKLGELFEPQAESKEAKLEYEARVQIAGEHPKFYLKDKQNLFERAFPRQLRDNEAFFESAIAGLLNPQMKGYLRMCLPFESFIQFNEKATRAATIVRDRYRLGEISADEALGSEAIVTSNSYKAGRVEAAHNLRNDDEYVFNVRPGQSVKKACFHCGSHDHLIANCSRKANGFPPTVPQMQRPFFNRAYQSGSKPHVNNDRGGDTGGPKRAQFRPKPSHSKPKGGKFRRFNRRVMTVYEDEEGNIYVEDEDQEGDEGQEGVEHVEPHQDEVAGEKDQPQPGQSDYHKASNSFLGMN